MCQQTACLLTFCPAITAAKILVEKGTLNGADLATI